MMELEIWLDRTVLGEMILTGLISMLPVVELRGGIPFGISRGLSLPLAVIASVAGNMAPVPFLILFTRQVFVWLRRRVPALEGLISRLEKKAEEKERLVLKYEFWGLFMLVAIPLPGTGAWTGALVAAIMDLRLKNAVPAILGGVLVAAAIVSDVVLGMFSL